MKYAIRLLEGVISFLDRWLWIFPLSMVIYVYVWGGRALSDQVLHLLDMKEDVDCDFLRFFFPSIVLLTSPIIISFKIYWCWYCNRSLCRSRRVDGEESVTSVTPSKLSDTKTREVKLIQEQTKCRLGGTPGSPNHPPVSKGTEPPVKSVNTPEQKERISLTYLPRKKEVSDPKLVLFSESGQEQLLRKSKERSSSGNLPTLKTEGNSTQGKHSSFERKTSSELLQSSELKSIAPPKECNKRSTLEICAEPAVQRPDTPKLKHLISDNSW